MSGASSSPPPPAAVGDTLAQTGRGARRAVAAAAAQVATKTPDLITQGIDIGLKLAAVGIGLMVLKKLSESMQAQAQTQQLVGQLVLQRQRELLAAQAAAAPPPSSSQAQQTRQPSSAAASPGAAAAVGVPPLMASASSAQPSDSDLEASIKHPNIAGLRAGGR